MCHLCSWSVKLLQGLVDKFPLATRRVPVSFGVLIWVLEWVGFANLPQRACYDLAGLGVGDLLPVAGWIRLVPFKLTFGRFLESFGASVWSGPENRTEEPEERLIRIFVRVPLASNKLIEIGPRVDLFELERHARLTDGQDGKDGKIDDDEPSDGEAGSKRHGSIAGRGY